MLLKFSLIIFLITIQLFAEVPLPIYKQVKDIEQYKTCIKTKDADQRIKCTDAIKKPFIEKGIDHFIQSFDQKYQNSVRSNISRLDRFDQEHLLDLYANIFLSLDKNHTQMELMKIKYNLIFYVIGLNDFSGACVANANKIFQYAPELKNGTFEILGKNVNIYTYIMEEAVFIDDIANLSTENADKYFDKLKTYLKHKEQYIIDALQGEPDDWAFNYLDIGKTSYNLAIDEVNKGNWKLAKDHLKLVYYLTGEHLDNAIETQKMLNSLNRMFKKTTK
jgi:hypothetical protein